MFQDDFNCWKNTKTFATQKNLEVCLLKVGLYKGGPLMVRTPSGRFTAVFPRSALDRANIPVGGVAHFGFKVLG